MQQVAVIGAGVSGLTCGVLLAEAGRQVTIFAEETGTQTTSAAAGAIWYPYDVEPLEKTIARSLRTFAVLSVLTAEPHAGVSIIELRCYARVGEIELPDWAIPLGAERVRGELPKAFASGFALTVPLLDTSVYLDYLVARFTAAGGETVTGTRLESLAEVPPQFALIVNCAGVGARELVHDEAVEPHRGQVVLVAKSDLAHAIVCDDAPLMYIFPRAHDCVFGGTNTISDDRSPHPHETAAIMRECTRVLATPAPEIRAERVGLRPYRRTGLRLERGLTNDGRTVVHNYGHGGSGFTLSWGCAEEVSALL